MTWKCPDVYHNISGRRLSLSGYERIMYLNENYKESVGIIKE